MLKDIVNFIYERFEMSVKLKFPKVFVLISLQILILKAVNRLVRLAHLRFIARYPIVAAAPTTTTASAALAILVPDHT